jgi:hypothetical protein
MSIKQTEIGTIHRIENFKKIFFCQLKQLLLLTLYKTTDNNKQVVLVRLCVFLGFEVDISVAKASLRRT